MTPLTAFCAACLVTWLVKMANAFADYRRLNRPRKTRRVGIRDREAA